MANELFVVLVIVSLYDAHLTLKVLKQGGREMNPLIRWAIGEFGAKPALIGIKAITLVAVYLIQPEQWAMLVLIGLYVAVCWHNTKQLRR